MHIDALSKSISLQTDKKALNKLIRCITGVEEDISGQFSNGSNWSLQSLWPPAVSVLVCSWRSPSHLCYNLGISADYSSITQWDRFEADHSSITQWDTLEADYSSITQWDR